MSYSAEVLADSPIIYWRLDEASGNFADSSGNGRTATLATGSAFVYQQPPLVNEGFSVRANGDDRAATDGHGLLSNGDVFTLEAWINLTASGQFNGYGIIEMGSSAPSFRVQNDGYLAILKSHVAMEGLSTITVNDGVTHHAVVKTNAGGTQIWIDGVNRSGVMSSQLYVAADPGKQTGFAGQWPGVANSPAVAADFDGYLDEIAIYDYELSDARIIAHYEAGIAVQAQAQVMTTLRHVSGHGVW